MGLFRTLFGRWNERQVPAGGDVGKMVGGGGGGGETRCSGLHSYFNIFGWPLLKIATKNRVRRDEGRNKIHREL